MKEWKVLKQYYTKPEHYAGFGTAKALRKATGLPKSKIDSFLRTQDSYTFHKPARKRFATKYYHVTNIDDLWEADLNDMNAIKKYNEPYSYILTVIDVFSKFAWAVPLKTKHGAEVAKAFANIFSHRVPKVLQTDKGTEFTNKTFRDVLKKHGVQHYNTKNNVKAAVIERWNRTLKTKMYRYYTHK